jgi:ureidoacrylate peracid hydrolase
MPVIYTKFVAGSVPTLLWSWSRQIAAQNACVRGFERFYSEYGRTAPCTDIIDELKTHSGDYIVEKYHYSAFRNTNLTDILRSEGRDTIIVCGTVTQICVFSTIHDAFHEGLKAVCASDCASTWDALQQRATLENIANKFGRVMGSDNIMAELT